MNQTVILIKEGYSLVYQGRTYAKDSVLSAPNDVTTMLIKERKALPYRPFLLRGKL